MKRELSIYLDLLRLVASLAVVVMHAGSFLLPALPGALVYNGSEAVAAFFVLSGLMMEYVTRDGREGAWQTYTLARVSRIVSVVAVALPLVWIVDRIGMALDPGPYLADGGFAPAFGAIAWIRALTFTNEVWFSHAILGSNEPYWSLGFEVPYYIMFGLAIFLRGRRRAVALAAWALLVGPKILAYLPLWLLGVLTYRIIRQPIGNRRHLGAILFAAGPLLYVGARLLRKYHLQDFSLTIFQPSSAADLVAGAAYYLLVAIAIAANIVGFRYLLDERIRIPERAAIPIRWLAGGSFTVYLVHMPLMLLVRASWPQVLASPDRGLLALGLVLAACYLVAELGERRKRTVRALIGCLFPAARQN